MEVNLILSTLVMDDVKQAALKPAPFITYRLVTSFTQDSQAA